MSQLFQAGDTLQQCQRRSPLDALETRMLIEHVTGYTRVQLITKAEQALNAEQAQQLSSLVQARQVGQPIAYLLGEREFFGLNFKVSPAVLIPRPDTELLVELALEMSPRPAHILDLGTGSGAIAVTLAAQEAQFTVTAADISPAALAIAQDNAKRLAANNPVRFFQSDWFRSIPAQQFDTIVSNPPYIVKDDEHLQQGDLRFEPIDALTDHSDGLSAYRSIIQGTPHYLRHGGCLLMEHGYHQAEQVQALLQQAGFQAVRSWQDLAGIWRVTGGVWHGN
ncbi:peptide chain release factor N(5)-glutamine methyltransferase [Undibacterium cyanobacteriorum]|uniref:Release factor glutamine methyltransferase n=1 Tax=Undibacterium cyanobacteriorum TaxID=3073561 RepID=A0ABY9RHT3_9BURK|nr:peptide chain release factor N(5)-glutamine methyltransferase [Undibacterium sp. 20NA77.5]WMW80229.1 peptide chain release factor N(5)-glutamine methyltransferase [Undibacterium sp. 20NA77.5]